MSVEFVTVIKASFPGKNGAGAISCPGLEVGDIVLFIGRSAESPAARTSANGSNGLWETYISVADEIQQITNSDFSSATFDLILLRTS